MNFRMRAVVAIAVICLSTKIAQGQVVGRDDSPAGKAALARSAYIDFSTPGSARKAMVITPEESERANRYDNRLLPNLYHPANPSNTVLITVDQIYAPLPISYSDVIVVGTVTSASPHLSKFGTNVYTTFVFTPETFLKPQKGPYKSSLLLERIGGVVLYPSGEKRFERTQGIGLPEPNYKYLFFLKSVGTTGSYRIDAGYALLGDHVASIDYYQRDLDSLSEETLIKLTRSLLPTQ